MAFIAVVRLQVRPERLADVLSLIRTEFAHSQGSGQGRLRGYVFQRLNSLTELLGCVEWDSQETYRAVPALRGRTRRSWTGLQPRRTRSTALGWCRLSACWSDPPSRHVLF